jgi:hypothetical protein
MTARTKMRRRPQLETLEGRALLSGPGALDPTFGGTGVATTPLSKGNDIAIAVYVQPDDKSVVAGDTTASGGLWDLARYNPNGTLDPSFGTGGKVVTNFSPKGSAAGGDLRAIPSWRSSGSRPAGTSTPRSARAGRSC